MATSTSPSSEAMATSTSHSSEELTSSPDLSSDGAALVELVARYSAPRRRTVEAALHLFARHGVGGTSLQAIADDLGLTKAAVYHQFRTKDEIALAVIEVQLEPLERVLAAIRSEDPDGDSQKRTGQDRTGEERTDEERTGKDKTGRDGSAGEDRRHRLLDAIIEVVVANRTSLSTLQNDPVLFRLLGEHPPSRRLWAEIFGELLGHGPDDRARIRASVLSAILGAVSFPLVADVDDATLRHELGSIARSLLPC